ncbi:aldo/keto reductase [Cryobacterium sinapicolor]|uniref:Aldo/keto reductase n=1 Tax=Cryobacterium sinapicolor TaxID=1259236 RepID=A0ABY2IZH1_9MICO|nr:MULTISPECIES: aldo/keto reductase [Cryobacterium]TFC90462.1 aldo/keto reductase [Cryobacterium sp. TMT3-29-2]TFC96482.1 aldo/keto reductase [Cryobacterium sinapicolor]
MTAAPTTSIPRVGLKNGETIPQLGFGVYQVVPADTRRSTLAALEVGYRHMHASGWVKTIGVSNFQPHHLQRLLDETGTVPAVNQIEVHPYLTQDDVRAFNTQHGIVTEAWSPIAQGKVLGDPVITAIAARLGRSVAQVTLRWHLQRGDIVFPKSVTRSRVEENFALFDFELTTDDLAAITALNRNERTGPDPDEFNWIP